MESKTLVCDRCAREGKFQIAVDSAMVQTRTHGMFRLDLCTLHLESLVRDLGAFNTDHVILAILEHTLQDRGSVPQPELQRITGAHRVRFVEALRTLQQDRKIRIEGPSKRRVVTWIAPRAVTNGAPREKRVLPWRHEKRFADHLAVYDWVLAYLQEHKDVVSRDLTKAVVAAGHDQGKLAAIRNKLRAQKLIRISGLKAGARWIYRGTP
jgi:hypothetical protein